jgi:hypothetical protein
MLKAGYTAEENQLLSIPQSKTHKEWSGATVDMEVKHMERCAFLVVPQRVNEGA